MSITDEILKDLSNALLKRPERKLLPITQREVGVVVPTTHTAVVVDGCGRDGKLANH